MVTESKNICFAIMPFDSSFDDVSQKIEQACNNCGLHYLRGDHRNQPGSVMPQILSDIRRASVIVADVSGHNPNVFYELGIAHQIKGPGQVVIITQSTEKSPYDVNEFRQIRYANNEKGRSELLSKLQASLSEALQTQEDKEVWSIIRGPVERTRLIVRDLQRVIANEAPNDLRSLTIRMISGLGSLAISNHEPDYPDLGPEYKSALIEERNTLREALVRGATLKSLIHPPRQFTPGMVPERLLVRYKRLIGLLEGRSDEAEDAQAKLDIQAMKRCEFLLTPVPMPHLLIIGNSVAYEGIKRGGRRGYHMTHCQTDPNAVHSLIEDFEQHFEECRNLMQTSPASENSVVSHLKAYLGEVGQSN